nr:MAG TPA_asm: hypothetical protein [Bacteriophage sp.]
MPAFLFLRLPQVLQLIRSLAYVLIGLSGSGRPVVCPVWLLLYLVYSYYNTR